MTLRALRLSDLLRGAGIRALDDIGPDPWVRGATLDSRRVEPGQLFLALPGSRTSGTAFVAEAVGRGATAIVAAEPRPAGLDPAVAWVRVAEPRRAAGPLARECHDRPDEAVRVVGITGTNGKTTVACLVESIARAAGLRAGRIGTLGSAVDGQGAPLARTTPEAPELYALLGAMRDAGVRIAAIEVSSHGLALHRVEGLHVAVGAFLNLGRDHLDFHGDLATYFEAKARLFDGLGPAETAVLPADSPHGADLARRTRATTLTFGRSAAAQVRLTDERCGLDGSSAILDTPAGKLPVRTFLLGRFNLDNVAAAAACALALELAPETIPAGILALETVAGRLERVEQGQPFGVVVDYAHTPAALSALLEWVREVSRGRILLVFGCGGDRDQGKRPEMGRAAALGADRIFLTSDNPRDEDPQQILDQIAAGVATVPGANERCRALPDREAAVYEALLAAGSGDIVILAGKGHETTQLVAGRERKLDDRDLARRGLSRLGYPGGHRARA